MKFPRFLPVAACTCLLFGCGSESPPANPKPQPTVEDDHVHEHERGKMMLADVSQYHVGLTAHLSAKEGNELDVFFETQDKEPKPVAVPLDKFTARVSRDGDDKIHELTFEPAPASERPKDEKAGTCSHFVAKAPWMKPEDVLVVSAEVELDGKKRTMRWKNFNPKKFAHHIE